MRKISTVEEAACEHGTSRIRVQKASAAQIKAYQPVSAKIGADEAAARSRRLRVGRAGQGGYC